MISAIGAGDMEKIITRKGPNLAQPAAARRERLTASLLQSAHDWRYELYSE